MKKCADLPLSSKLLPTMAFFVVSALSYFFHPLHALAENAPLCSPPAQRATQPGTQVERTARDVSNFLRQLRPSSASLGRSPAVEPPVHPLRAAVQRTRELLDSYQAPEVPLDTIQQLWNRIIALDRESAPLTMSPATSREQQQVMLRIGEIFRNLLAQGRIRFTTEKMIEDASRVACLHKSNHCEMNGFYSPLTHAIYLSPNQSPEEMARSLYHELHHAYQYTYRFPMDHATLQRAVSAGLLREENLNEHLSIYYEGQANYKTMRISPTPVWTEEFSNRTDLHGVLHSIMAVATAGEGLRTFYRNSPPSELQQALPSCWGNIPFNAILPGTQPGIGALMLPDLMTYENLQPGFFNSAGFLDMSFLQKYARAIDRTYFGTDDTRRMHQHTYNDLSQQSCIRLGNETVTTQAGCQTLMRDVQASADSPMVEWLLMPQARIDGCSAYQGSGSTNEDRARFTQRLLESTDAHSPFGSIRPIPGSGGTPPSLLTIPMLPNLTVRPEAQ